MVARIEETVEVQKEGYRFYVDENAPGMDDIRLVLSDSYGETYIRPYDRLVGTFGIIAEDGQELLLTWKVDGHRKDKRHGAVDPEMPSEYGKDLFNSMFAGW